MTSMEKTDHRLAVEYTRIVLGMDQLYRSKLVKTGEALFDNEGLTYSLSDEHPITYSNWSDVKEDLNYLRLRYLDIEDEVRRNYMQQQIGSVLCLADWCAGVQLPFRDKVRGLLYVNENPLSQAERGELHRRLDVALAGRGYKGSLHEKVQAWEAERRVPVAELETVLKELLAVAKQRVVDRMFPQMADVEVVPEIVHDFPFNAYCDYVNGKMYLNGDIPFTYEGLKHLVTHECFPGHTTHMRFRELGMQSGDIPIDASMVVVNTASSSVFEGIADNGIYFIDWLETEDDHIYQIYQQIRSTSGMNAAHMLHAERKPEQEVAQFLAEYAFGEENWIASRLRFFTHPLRSPFIYTYWRGNEAVKQVYEREAPEDRQRFFQFIYSRMLSADTVKQFV